MQWGAAEAQRRCSGGAAEERRRWRRPHQTRGRGELAAARELLGRHVLGKVGGAHAAQRDGRGEARPREREDDRAVRVCVEMGTGMGMDMATDVEMGTGMGMA